MSTASVSASGPNSSAAFKSNMVKPVKKLSKDNVRMKKQAPALDLVHLLAD